MQQIHPLLGSVMISTSAFLLHFSQLGAEESCCSYMENSALPACWARRSRF